MGLLEDCVLGSGKEPEVCPIVVFLLLQVTSLPAVRLICTNLDGCQKILIYFYKKVIDDLDWISTYA